MKVRLVDITAVLLLICGTGGVVWSSRAIDPVLERTAVKEVLYIPSAKTLKALSLGYTGLLADIYWTRAVQYFGRKHMEGAEAYKLLRPLLDITTTLDPKLYAAYEFGSFFLTQKPPMGAGEPDAAIALIRKGIAANPDNWRLYYNLGFVYWMEKRDYVSAAQAFEQGARIPGSMIWMKTLAGEMALHGHDLATARMMWASVLSEIKEGHIRDNAILRLQSIDSDEAVMILQERVDNARRQLNRIPGWSDLIELGLVRKVPLDPAGNPYRINAQGRVVVADKEKLPFITQGLPE